MFSCIAWLVTSVSGLVVIPVVLKALAYDERLGAHSVGELIPQLKVLLLVCV